MSISQSSRKITRANDRSRYSSVRVNAISDKIADLTSCKNLYYWTREDCLRCGLCFDNRDAMRHHETRRVIERASFECEKLIEDL